MPLCVGSIRASYRSRMKFSQLLRQLAFVVTFLLAQMGWPQASFDLDPTFQTEMDVRYVASVLPDATGGVIISGRFRFPGVQNEKYTARIDPYGILDPTYNATVLGGGHLTGWNSGLTYVGTTQTVRRLLPSGDLDPAFIEMNLGRYFTSLQGGDYHVYPDGRVLMSGAHHLRDSIRGFEGLYSLIWFSNQGYLDTTRTHRLCNGVIYWIHEQTDGRILCTGTMTTYEGQPVSRVFRVEADGVLDPSFNTPFQPWGGPRDYFELPDGRILLGGTLKINGSDTVRCMLRIFPNGDLDPSYTLNSFDALHTPSNSPAVLSIYELSSDRYIITGVFDKFNGQDRGGIAMIDSSGNLVQDVFDGMGCGAYEYVVPSGSTTYKYIAGIVPSNDGGFFIHGGYHGYDDGTTNDTTQRMVSKLFGLSVGVPPLSLGEGLGVRAFPNPCTTHCTVQVEQTAHNGTLTLLDLAGRVVRKWPMANTTVELSTIGIAAGNYRLQYRTERTLESTLLMIAP